MIGGSGVSLLNGLVAMRLALLSLMSFGVVAATFPAAAQDVCDEVCQAFRKAQDPLANVRAIMTDNALAAHPDGGVDTKTKSGGSVFFP